jgi:hypothetical protein
MSIQTFPCPNGEICYAEECTQAKQCMHLGEATHYEQLGYPKPEEPEEESDSLQQFKHGTNERWR